MQNQTTFRCSYTTILVAVCVTGLLTIPASSRGQSGAPVSLNLAQAIDLALKQNRSLHLAELSVADSRHKKQIAHSDYFPHITNDSAVHHVTEFAGVAIPAGAFGVPPATGPIPAKALFIDQGAHTSYTSGTQLAQPLTQMFKINASNRAAAADVDKTKVELSQAENEIALQVRKVYCGLLIAQLKLQAANEQVSASEVKNSEDVDAVAKGRALEVADLESRAAVLDAKHTVLTERLTIHNLTLSLADLLGLPLNSQLLLDSDVSALAVEIPSREECLRIARERSPAILIAQQTVVKARAGLDAAKDEYIPDITGLARYSYQSGIPFLVHNFGTFGFNVSYDLFDGGSRIAKVKDAKTLLEQAQVNLDKAIEETDVAVESAYDAVQQSQDMVRVVQEALEVRTEAARLADRQYEQSEVLASTRAAAHAKLASSASSLVEAKLGLSLAQGDLKRVIGQLPR